MPPLPRRAWAYLLLTTAAGPAALALALAAGPTPTGDPRLALLLVLLGALALQFPLQISQQFKLNVASAVYFAALLLLGTPLGAAVVGLGELVGGLTLALRRNPRNGRRMRGLKDTAFNVGQLLLAAVAGGAVYDRLAPPLAPAPLTLPADLWAVPLAAAAMYLVNTAAVTGMVALQRGQSPWNLGREVVREDALLFGGLYLVGALGAFTAADHPWSIALLAVPTAMLYVALRRQVQVLEQTLSAVEAMADAVDLRDRYTGEHSARVATNAELIARALGMPADEVEAIRRAGRVHDLGKVAVPDSVLHKPGKLDAEEWAVMKQHPEVGYQILARFHEYRAGRELVRLHHERLDGKGYPFGVGGDELPIGAQILALCDTLDAMTSDRPYRKGLAFATAMREIERGKGTQFHPRVVEAFERLAAAPEPAHRLAVAQAEA